MDGASEILVIILALLLVVFLCLAIALAVLLIKISRQIKSITGSAERTIQSVESAATQMNKATSSVMMLNLVKNVVKGAMKAKKRAAKKEEASHVKGE